MNVTTDPSTEIAANKWESPQVFYTYGSGDLHGVTTARGICTVSSLR